MTGIVRRSLSMALTAAIALSPAIASRAMAQDTTLTYSVDPGEKEKIDRHGVCRMVSNTLGTSIMVPTKSAAEWSTGAASFLSNVDRMEGISVSACGGAWTAAGVCSQAGLDSCVLIDWWVGSYVVVVDGEIDRACINPDSMARGVRALTATDKTNWLHYAKTVRAWPGYHSFRGNYKYLNDIGFTDEMAAKATHWCNIKPDYDTWYSHFGNENDLGEVLNDANYPWRVGELITQSASYWETGDQAEIWIYSLTPPHYTPERMFHFDEYWVTGNPAEYAISFLWDDPDQFQNSSLFVTGSGYQPKLSVGLDFVETYTGSGVFRVDGTSTTTVFPPRTNFTFTKSWVAANGQTVTGTFSMMPGTARNGTNMFKVRIGNCIWKEGRYRSGMAAMGDPELSDITRVCTE